MALAMFADYRTRRLAGKVLDLYGRKVEATFSTCNNEQDLLNAVIVELQRMCE